MSTTASPRLPTGNGPTVHSIAPPRRGPRFRLRFGHFLFVLVVGAMAAVPFVPVEIPFVVDTYGQIKSSQEWALVRAEDGHLTASVFHYDTGLGGEFGVFQFGSEGSVRFSLDASLQPGRVVAIGDTIGAIYSSEVQERIVSLNGRLTAARASLAVQSTGGRNTTIREAEMRLQLAQQRHAEHLKQIERSAKLFAEGLIAEERYEREKSDARLLDVQVDIAATELEAAQTGEKPEELELIRANIAALENEIGAVQRRAASHVLTAPISGVVFRPFSSDTLLTIADTGSFAVYLPVKWSDYPYVSQASDIRLRMSGSTKDLRATLTSLSQKIRLLNGDQVVMATAILNEPTDALMPGMLASCRIDCAPVTALEYLKRLFTALLA